MLLESLSHLMAFDVEWFASLVLGNLHWVFALAAFAFVAHGSKKWLWSFLLFVALLYAQHDLLHGILGWHLIPLGAFVAYDFVLRTFLQGTRLEKHMLKILVASIFTFAYLNTFYWHWGI